MAKKEEQAATHEPTWDDVMEGDTKQSSEKATFTTFPEGITLFRVLDAVPFVRWTHWMNQHKRSINCPGYDCPICKIRKAQKAAKEEYSINMTKRYSINILNRSTGNVEILDQGKTFFDELRDFNTEQDLREYDIRAKRKGLDTSTTYRLDKEKPAPLTDAELALAAKKTDLPTYLAKHTVEQINRILAGEAWDVVMGETSNVVDESREEVTVG